MAPTSHVHGRFQAGSRPDNAPRTMPSSRRRKQASSSASSDAASSTCTWPLAQSLTQFLIDEGLAVGSHEELLAKGLTRSFSLTESVTTLGMDVHDLENFGDRPSYPLNRKRPSPFGLCYLRLDLPLVAGWVVTVEPGFYVAPAILEHPDLRESLGDCIRWDRLADWRGFGGIRIEDDIHITEDGPEILTHATPKEPDAIEELVGTRPSPEESLCGP